jgi:hypothetical protein
MKITIDDYHAHHVTCLDAVWRGTGIGTERQASPTADGAQLGHMG